MRLLKLRISRRSLTARTEMVRTVSNISIELTSGEFGNSGNKLGLMTTGKSRVPSKLNRF